MHNGAKNVCKFPFGILGSTLSEDLLNDHGDTAGLGPVDIRVIPASPNGGKNGIIVVINYNHLPHIPLSVVNVP